MLKAQTLLVDFPVIEILLALTTILLAVLIFLLIYFFKRSRRFIPYLLQTVWRRDFSSFDRYAIWAYDERLFSIIESAERKYEVELSWAAREMLAIPVVERLQDRKSVDWRELELSINKIVQTMREDHSVASEGPLGTRNAVAVIGAFFRQFCNIPPFCSPSEGRPA